MVIINKRFSKMTMNNKRFKNKKTKISVHR